MRLSGRGAPPAPPAPALPEIATTTGLVPLCGSADEPAVRAILPTVPPCAELLEIAYVVTHLAAGTLLVVATEDGRTLYVPPSRRVVVALDGHVRADLPTSEPRTTADSDALALAAIVVSHGGIVAVDAPSRRRTTPWVVRAYFEELPLGVIEGDGPRRTSAIANERPADATGEASVCIRFDATVDARGAVTITRVPLTTTDAENHTTMLALSTAPPVRRTAGRAAVCGSPDEAAIRVRVPDLPPCSAELADVYVAAGTTAGDLVVVAWNGQTDGVRTILGAQVLAAVPPRALVPREPDDITPILQALVLEMSDGGLLAVDTASGRALLGATPGDRRLFAQLGSPPLGLRTSGDEHALSALVVRETQDHTPPYYSHYRSVARYDVTLPADGRWTATRRYLASERDGVEIAHAEAQAHPWPDDEPAGSHH